MIRASIVGMPFLRQRRLGEGEGEEREKKVKEGVKISENNHSHYNNNDDHHNNTSNLRIQAPPRPTSQSPHTDPPRSDASVGGARPRGRWWCQLGWWPRRVGA